MSHIKKYVIKEATRKRCQIIPASQDVLKEFRSISLELYHLMYEADAIDFCVYIRISDEIVKFIKPNELSKELLAQVWNATQKANSDVEVCVRNTDIPRFQRLIDRIRKQKINALLEKDPSLDSQALHVFADLSSASQMIVRGGINEKLARKVTAAASYMVSNLMNNDVAMGTLSRMIYIDPTLYDHSASVAMFAVIMATRQLEKKLSQKEAVVLAQCGLYHDTGKSCVPSCILNKPSAFTPSEYKVMQTHTILGHKELMAAIEVGAPIDPLVARVAVEHHERFNGQGYPYGRRGRAEQDSNNGIHLYTRIVSIADAYSALLMKRVYKPALEPHEAIRLLSKNAHKDFDGEIFRTFVAGCEKSLHKVTVQRKAS